MQRPLLLIVDGESLKTSGLEKALEKDGWDLAWTTSLQAPNVGLMGQEPSLVLMDPARSSVAGIRAVLDLREQNPSLPLILVRGEDPAPAAIPATAFLDRTLGVERWSDYLKGFLPRLPVDRKFTTEDLFGDILADIGGTPAAAEPKTVRRPAAALPKPVLVQPLPRPVAVPVPVAPPAPVKALPVPPATRKPAPMVSTGPKPVDLPPVSEPASDAPAAPAPAEPPMPEASVLPDLFGEILGPLVEPPPSRPLLGRLDLPPGTAREAEGTPFENGEAKPAEVSTGLDVVDSLGSDVSALEFIGSSDHTPAARLPQQEAASLVLQPPPRPLELEPPQEYLDVASLEEFGNYYLIEKIAVGGMAELFKARQRGVHNFEKIVAIKRILPHLSDNDEFVRMFIDEAKLAAQLTHPNIVQIFDLGKASGFYYIAMEYVDGKDLRSLLRKVREYRSPFPEAVAACVTMKVAMALDYAHRKRGMNEKELKLVHRDVSPQNVLISSEGAVKLVDFGIAKAATKSTQTMAGALKGKLLYMSPEQALGQSLDNRSDIYSLGLVLFELLSGERCFQADSELGVLEKVRLGRVQNIQTVNPLISSEMAAILDKALQKNVDQRYGSARLMERDLKALLVKFGNEPTDHDVAEYVNTLLKGTKEDLDVLLASRFAVAKPRHAAAAPPMPPAVVPPRLEDPPTTVEVRRPQSRSTPPPEIREAPRKELPRWLLPVLLCVALVGLLILLFFTRGTNG